MRLPIHSTRSGVGKREHVVLPGHAAYCSAIIRAVGEGTAVRPSRPIVPVPLSFSAVGPGSLDSIRGRGKVSGMDRELGAPHPPGRVKYLAAVAVAITVAMTAVIAVTVDAPGRISRALSGKSLEDLFSSPRLDSELDVVRTQLGGQPIRRMDVTSNLISVEAVAADGLLHLYWVRDGEVEDMDSMTDLHAGETAFTASDVSGPRIRAAVSDVRSLGKPGEIELVSYIFRPGYPLSVAVWIRHDPVSSVLHFDPRGGSSVVREESIETDGHTSSFGGCWC